jgi:seryl-tRNA synthetase
MSNPLFASDAGMATLTRDGIRVFEALNALFLDWSQDCDAEQKRYPALIRVADLDRLNYFHNFPQIVLCACGLDAAMHPHHAARKVPIADIANAQLEAAGYCLLPAACYNIYLSLQGQRLAQPEFVTTIASCFRNESHYRGLERLRSFTMREIVCVGTREAVKAHLQAYRARIASFLDRLALPFRFEIASDPFFDKQGPAARAARIFPTKEEIVFDGKLAIGSINYHRRFFGERCDIEVAGQTAHTGCVAFGMERWMHALSAQFGPDAERIIAELNAARDLVLPARVEAPIRLAT